MPLPISARGCWEFERTGWLRRDILKIGSLGLAGWSLPGLLAAEAAAAGSDAVKPRAKSVIFYHHYGAPSHIDTFDPKPEAPVEIRGEFGTIASCAPGFHVCEIMPRIASVCDRLAVIRSMSHRTANHNPAVYLAITGRTSERDQVQVGATPNDWPAYGAVVGKFMPSDGSLPVAVQLPHYAFDQVYRCPGQTGGILGSAYDPLVVQKDPSAPNFQVDEVSLRIEGGRLEDRRRLLKSVDRQLTRIESQAAVASWGEHYERAFSMLASRRAKAAFDLEQEDPSLRDRYGRHKSGQTLLLARRLVEAGVRFVTCFSGSNPGDGWDTHTDNFNKLKKHLMPEEDQAFSALIEDLDSRGLLSETLVVWSGEFGRKPQIGQPNPLVNNIGPGGRDHWPPCYSLVLAGAGVCGGMVYSESDGNGEAPRSRPHSPADLSATLFWALGINPHAEIQDRLGRPFRISEGEPITGVFG